MRRLQKLGLQRALLLSFTTALLLILAVLYVLVPQEVDKTLTMELGRKGSTALKELDKRIRELPNPSDAQLGTATTLAMAAVDPGAVKLLAVLDEELNIRGVATNEPVDASRV